MDASSPMASSAPNCRRRVSKTQLTLPEPGTPSTASTWRSVFKGVRLTKPRRLRFRSHRASSRTPGRSCRRPYRIPPAVDSYRVKLVNIGEIVGMAPVIPILTVGDVEHAVPLARALVAGGLRVLEITLRT